MNWKNEIKKINIPYTVREPIGRGIVEFRMDMWPGWQRDVMDVALEHAVHVQRTEVGMGSLDSNARLDYWVVDGVKCREAIPRLDEQYRNEMPARIDLEMGVAGSKVGPLIEGLNINLLAGAGEEYEWHLDVQPFTVVIFATTLEPGDGGELLYVLNDEIHAIRPVAGRAVCFDGSAIPHKVAALQRDVIRLTVVEELLVPSDHEPRAPDHDAYLYGLKR